MSSRRVVKGVIVQIRERRKNRVDAAIGESASKLRTGREPRRPLPRRSRRRPQRACIGSLTISPPKLLVEVEPMDKMRHWAKRPTREFYSVQAVGDFARRASLRRDWPPVAVRAGDRGRVTCRGNSAVRVPGSTPVGVPR
ncbi:hypothetical protein EVAR_19133_1 [Eumeta japonica]|uniref:Uncharacterized protein n=1 Tax=Eumeta variegata TaxID=151549 RepID=A0A4C1SS78_EUMVA|nr:hypothetical protein EVAR_19133_1 [Eumeta japonica]